MSIDKPSHSRFEEVLNAKRETGYRERALKIYPWICGRCAREFNRKDIRVAC